MDRPHLWGNNHPAACVFCVAAVYGEKGQVALPQNDAAFADPMGSWRTSVAGQCVADNDNFLDFSLCFDVAVYMSSGGVCRIQGVWGTKAVTREEATERRYYVKAQRGKIIVLCLCLIFAMLIISGKASKLGTYLYVRCNYTHLEEFAAEVIQTGAIPDDRYKRRDVRYYPECGMIEFSTFSSGFGSETVYEGFYYSDEDVPFGFQGTSMSFQSDGGGWSWHESDGDNFEYTEKILGKWYWYRMHF